MKPMKPGAQSRHTLRRLMRVTAAAVCAMVAAGASAAVAELSIVRRAWTIGVESGPPEQEFGKIVDAAWDSAGSVYLLDGAARMIRVFSAEGRFVRTVSREGRGPGELITPRSIKHDGASTLYVLDAVNGISLWRTTANATTYLRTIPNQTWGADDFCLLGTRLFVYAPAADLKLIREVAPDGRVLRAFGDLFGAADHPPMARIALSGDGKLSCHARHDLLVVTAGQLADTRAYRASAGSVAWRDSLRGFSPHALRIHANGLTRSISFGTPNHMTLLLRPLGDDVVLAQARRVHRDEKIDSWMIDVRSGRQVWATDQLMRLPVMTPARGVVIQDQPHPIVSLVELRYTTR